jgi:hypothetical protein
LIPRNRLAGAAATASVALLALAPGAPAFAQTGQTSQTARIVQTAQTSWTITPGPTSGYGVLRSVYAISPTDAVAVGVQDSSSSSQAEVLVEQWNGSSWQVEQVPTVSQFPNQLFSVSGTSAGDIWAVGDTQTAAGGNYAPEAPVIMHYNGSSWTTASSPSTGSSFSRLQTVKAFGPDDAWASGFSLNSNATATTEFTLHWNGTSWSQATLPDATMQVVGGTSSDDVWFMSSTAAWHYNGSTFTQVSGPVSHTVTAISPTDAWGVATVDGTVELNQYNGTAWSTVTSLPSSDSINGLTALSADDVWAVGDESLSSGGGGEQTLTMNWNGSTWSTVSSPTGSEFSTLSGAAAASPSTVFAVGQGGGTSGNGTLALITNNG